MPAKPTQRPSSAKAIWAEVFVQLKPKPNLERTSIWQR